MKLHPLLCGYLPLVDSAPLIIAKELGFAAEEGLALTLMKQPSWAALRDHLALGQIDMAQMLAPMPIAMSLGLSGLPTAIDALMVLSVNGTVFGVSDPLYQRMLATGWQNGFDDPGATAMALLAADGPLRIGVPFAFSMHHLLVDYWLSAAPGYCAERIQIRTVPPPQMAQAVQQGLVDAFCVGEPWGSVAVQGGHAALVLPGARIWNAAPEKVLGARRNWLEANTGASQAMIRAIHRACRWLAQPENTSLAVEILARSQHLNLPDYAIDPALTGRIGLYRDHAPVTCADFLRFFDSAANLPQPGQAGWIAARLAHLYPQLDAESLAMAQDAFRADLYRAALADSGTNLPQQEGWIVGARTTASTLAGDKGEMILPADGFFDGAVFDFQPR